MTAFVRPQLSHGRAPASEGTIATRSSQRTIMYVDLELDLESGKPFHFGVSRQLEELLGYWLRYLLCCLPTVHYCEVCLEVTLL
ncbi:hypothetical protein AVEN_16828-1 [Araneus ventricosus]|uniref:Uncharacterized protein n=1 Tax=Araneus ventricosus TaxID=182803 RepID=A0A4Y2BQ22_ARAVE|nr:hypothetical protein AVEN_16828-1 [Araneus ventricosus]